MLPARHVVSVEEVRAVVRDAVEGSSVRRVAAEIGLPHGTVASFLKGSQPYGRTMEKLRAWYEGQAGEVLRLRQEVERLRKRVAELERELKRK